MFAFLKIILSAIFSVWSALLLIVCTLIFVGFSCDNSYKKLSEARLGVSKDCKKIGVAFDRAYGAEKWNIIYQCPDGSLAILPGD